MDINSLSPEEFDAIKDKARISAQGAAFIAKYKAEAAGAGLQAGGNGKSASTIVMRCAADITPKELRWLWPGKIPAGKLTLLVGDPGLGKSVISLDIAARVSIGALWPDAPMNAETGDVIILSAEDDPADTIIPRLNAIGANLDRIFTVAGVRRGNGRDAYFSIAEDLQLLEAIITDQVRLIIIDPISAYLGDIDSHINTSVRAVLAPLAGLAARTEAAVFGISHLNKGAGAAIYRVQGSIAFTAAARAVWAVCKDMHDETGKRRMMLPVKCNLAADTEGLSYELTDAGGNASVSWGDSVLADAAEALSHEGPEEMHGRVEAEAWLRELLADGPVEAGEIRKAARDNGIAERTLWRAKKAAGIKAMKTGFNKGWIWSLPGAKAAKSAEECQGCHPRNLGNLGGDWQPSAKDQDLFDQAPDPRRRSSSLESGTDQIRTND